MIRHEAIQRPGDKLHAFTAGSCCWALVIFIVCLTASVKIFTAVCQSQIVYRLFNICDALHILHSLLVTNCNNPCDGNFLSS